MTSESFENPQSPSPALPRGNDRGSEDAGNPWAWAAYLGASWTWCIGMFLPVLLIRDYGPWAWVIFAVPNAVGAAAMGWVLRSVATSRDYTVKHASACRLFSFVTIAFQLFFSIWMLPRLVGPIGWIGVAILVQSAFTPITKTKWLLAGGIVALLASVLVTIGLANNHALQWPRDQGILPGDAVGLALVCLAGFVACPYLDLTFHRGRQSTTDAGAKVAFGLGFCVLFASMIVLTFFYALHMIRLGNHPDSSLPELADALIAIHLTVQMAYTVHVHGAELQRQSRARDDAGTMRVGLGLWLAIGLAAGLAAVFGIQNNFAYHDRSVGELCYRTFMAFYGLLFPVYVLLAIRRPKVSTPMWLGVSAVALPFYWLAFIEGRMAWAAAGVGVICIGTLVGRWVTRPALARPTG